MGNQAALMLRRLGYTSAMNGSGGQSAAASGDLLSRYSAAQMQQRLRGGGGLDMASPGLQLKPGISTDVPPSPALAQPRGLSSANPNISITGGIPGQNSPLTSSGNAAGYRPYRLPPGVEGP